MRWVLPIGLLTLLLVANVEGGKGIAHPRHYEWSMRTVVVDPSTSDGDHIAPCSRLGTADADATQVECRFSIDMNVRSFTVTQQSATAQSDSILFLLEIDGTPDLAWQIWIGAVANTLCTFAYPVGDTSVNDEGDSCRIEGSLFVPAGETLMVRIGTIGSPLNLRRAELRITGEPANWGDIR